MEQCVYCGSEARFRFNDRPVCLDCDASSSPPAGADFNEQIDMQRIPPGNVQLNESREVLCGVSVAGQAGGNQNGHWYSASSSYPEFSRPSARRWSRRPRRPPKC